MKMKLAVSLVIMASMVVVAVSQSTIKLTFLNGTPKAVEIKSKYLGVTTSRTLTESDLQGENSMKEGKSGEIPFKTKIPLGRAGCPSISYKITEDSAEKNALRYVSLSGKNYWGCSYEETKHGQLYSTGTLVDMKGYP